MGAMSSKQKRSVADAVAVEVRKFIAAAILFNEKVAAEVGLNATDLQCLGLLHLQGAATPGELARCASVTTGGMTVVLDRLQRAGYVSRQPNSKDRRSSIIQPVPARMRKLEHIYRSKGETLARVLWGYREQELQLLLDFFRKTNPGPDVSPRPLALSRRERGE
jgi:MarR family transcriptional regulator, organic hydroperoxide resistance regulator